MDERLNEINRELKELNEALARQGRMEAQWKDLQDQRAERDRRVMETGRVFRKEQDDVDRLRKEGLRPCCSPSPGQGGAPVQRAAGGPGRQAPVRSGPAGSGGSRRAHRGPAAGEGRPAHRPHPAGRPAGGEGRAAQSLGGETGARLARLDQQLDELEHQRREVGEAISAGRTAESALSAVLNSLDSAETGGLGTMLGGGLLTTMAKHGDLDDAQAGIGWAQQCLSRFRTELADVRDMELPQVQVGEFATFADYFFDGIFVDWYIQSRINDAQRGVEAVDSRVCEVLNRLQWMDQELAEEQDGLKREREGLLLRSSGSD